MRSYSITLVLSLVLLAADAAVGQDVVVEWNRLAQQHIAGPPFSQTRQYAMVNVAMADAVVAIEGQYEPFHVPPPIPAPTGASAQAAAAQAAHDVLVMLAPDAAATLDAALEETLAPIAPGLRMTGVEVGRAVASEVLAWRENDGFADANPQPAEFMPSTLPGIWQETASGAAQFSMLRDAEPFGLVTATQYLPVPPPQLESAEYAEDFNEVQQKGRATGSTRTPEETRSAQLWAGIGEFANATNPFRLWQNVARDMAEADGLSLVQTARLYALLAASIHDSLQTSQASKFVYRLWRPETAIAHADIDENPATTAEPGWTPLLTTPPYPSHSGNMACIGGGAAQMLGNVLGSDAKSFTPVWSTAEGAVVHSQPYESFWALAQDAADGRIWGGIHYRFESEASQAACTEVADYIFATKMLPL